MNGKASVDDVEVRHERGRRLARARPDDRDRRPLLGDAGRVDAQVRPFGLEPLLEVVEDGGGVAGRRRHVEPLLGRAARSRRRRRPSRRRVHISAVPARPDLQRRERVRVDAVEEDARVRALDVDLAEGRRVHDRRPRSARRAHSRRTASSIALAVAREVARALPLADVLEHRAVRRHATAGSGSSGPGRRGAPRSRPASWREADRHGRRPERRHADGTDLLAERSLRRSRWPRHAEVLPWSMPVPIVV